MLGRVVELINGHDDKTKGVKIIMGKTKIVISRPVNKVYPLEVVEESEETLKENEQRDRPRRQAAIIADLRKKLENKYKHNSSSLIVVSRVLLVINTLTTWVVMTSSSY